MRHLAKLCAYPSDRCGDMIVFRLFKTTAVHYVGFLKRGNFNFRYGSEGQCAPSPSC